ncbi:hypothetical protein BP5796_02789 [Coleophoma crateriformis]|uniref:BZIP domain-containing protein n=1 Tax=Coleophoma crateriformis TaxID=565419 RepID=A0A3D8SZA7_9HELO|nr:hypothetical protein BP5796_02789 [Coleophoma crateriformis]
MSPQLSSDGNSRSTTPGTWSSGRKLTLAQREKKREKNRHSRQDARQRQNARLIELEAELRSVKAALAEKVSPVDSTVNITPACVCSTVPAPQESSWVGFSRWDYPRPEPPLPLPTSDGSNLINRYSTAGTRTYLDPTNDGKYQAALGFVIQEEETAPNHTAEVEHPKILPGPELHPLQCPTYARHTTEFTNDIFTRAGRLEFSQVCTDELRNEDVLAKATMFGWDVAFQSWKTPCSLWLLLRSIDTVLLGGCHTPLERMAILRAVHIMSLSIIIGKTGPKQDVPHWYRPRPAQQLITHDLVADFIVWPGMRERIVLTGSANVLTNEFWMAFFSCFRFHWSGEVHEAFDFNPENGQHTFSGELFNRLWDINHWRMDMSFFNRFPAFADDVLPFQHVPNQITLWSDRFISKTLTAVHQKRWAVENSKVVETHIE